MKFPDLVHAVKPEPHHAHAAGGERARHVLGLRLADARVHAHADVGDVGPRDPAQLPHDAGLRRAHLPPGQRARRSRVREVPLEPGGRHAFARLGRGGEDLRRRPGLPSPRPVGGDRGRRVSRNGSSACRSSPRSRPSKFSFDVLDATKIVPEELVPVRPVGPHGAQPQSRQLLRRDRAGRVLHRAHRAGHRLHATIRCSPGRIHSYVDTQISRLGGPNFHEIPINAPVAQVHNNQRDGMHRQAIHRGRVAYEPNSLGGGCPFQAGAQGFTSFPQPIDEDKVRGKPEKFADHYTQATLFYDSQTPVEQAHIVRGVPLRADQGAGAGDPRARGVAARQRRCASSRRRGGRGPRHRGARRRSRRVRPRNVKPEVKTSPALSLLARPGDGSIRTRRIAILVADGVDGDALRRDCTPRSSTDGAVPRFVGPRLGAVRTANGDDIEVEVTLETAPSVLFDAVVMPGRRRGGRRRSRKIGQALEFVKDQYRHCKPILALGAGKRAAGGGRHSRDIARWRRGSWPAESESPWTRRSRPSTRRSPSTGISSGRPIRRASSRRASSGDVISTHEQPV